MSKAFKCDRCNTLVEGGPRDTFWIDKEEFAVGGRGLSFRAPLVGRDIPDLCEPCWLDCLRAVVRALETKT